MYNDSDLKMYGLEINTSSNIENMFNTTMREYENTLFPELNDTVPHDILHLMGQNSASESSTPSSEGSSILDINPSQNILATSPSGPLIVALMHKPRGSKGAWLNVDPAQRIRVTKGKGKRLKLEIRFISPEELEDIQSHLRFDKVKVEIRDLETGSLQGPTNDTFSIESAKTSKNIAELEIKLFKVFCKRLKFCVQIPTLSGEIVSGESVEFATHNSGTLGNINGSGATNKSVKSEQTSPPSSDEFDSQEPSPPLQKPPPPQPPQRNPRVLPSKPVVPPRQLPQPQHPQHQPPPVYSHFVQPQLSSPMAPPVPYYSQPLTSHQQMNPSRGHPQIMDMPAGQEAKRKRLSPPYTEEPYIQQSPLPEYESTPTVIHGSLDVKGAVRARAFIQFSDERLKTNITDLVDAIDIVSKLKGKSYEWKPGASEHTEGAGGRRVIGLIAQEVQRVIPEVVTQDPVTGFFAVSYAEILPVLIDAFNDFLKTYKHDKKDTQEQLQDLRNKVTEISQSMSTQNAKTEEMDHLLKRVSYLSKELLTVQQYQKVQQMDTKQLKNIRAVQLQRRKSFLWILSSSFGLSMISFIIGVILLSLSGVSYPIIEDLSIGVTPIDGAGLGNTTTTSISTTSISTSISTTGTTTSGISGNASGGNSNGNASGGNSNANASGGNSNSNASSGKARNEPKSTGYGVAPAHSVGSLPNVDTQVETGYRQDYYVVGLLLLVMGIVGMFVCTVLGFYQWKKFKQEDVIYESMRHDSDRIANSS